MLSWAVVVLDGELDALTLPVAGVPLWKRLILTLQDAGLERFLLLGSRPAADVTALRQDLVTDQRFRGEAFWLQEQEEDPAQAPRELYRAPFLLVSGEELYDPLLIRRFIITTTRHDPSGEEKFALVDARQPFPCPSMEGIRVTRCYWRTKAPVAFCPSHVFHPVEFAGAFVCPPALVDALLTAWHSRGRPGLMEALTGHLELGCSGYLVAGKYRLWRIEAGEKGKRRAEMAVLAQLRAYREGRLERVFAGRVSGWLTLNLAKVRWARTGLAAFSGFFSLVSFALFAAGGYWWPVAGTVASAAAATFTLALDDLSRIRLGRGSRIGGLAFGCDSAAKLLPLAGISADLLMKRGDLLPLLAGLLAIGGYFVAATWPTRRVAGRLRRLRRHLRGHSYLYLLGATSLIGRPGWVLWCALVASCLVGILGWLRRRAHPLTRVSPAL